MYIRKKNNENSRIKRPAKRSKSCDMFFTSGYGFYLKPIAIFSALLTIDFLMEIRLEYLWSCWLLMKSMTDSYKYQGLIFSLFFMLIVLTSDIICYLLIPITWLFFLASSYVWIQLVGYTERGICLPTVIICLIFFYVEYILRLRGFSHVSLSMEICRPFAANGIGYPVVTMGFGLKSYVTYKFRVRKQQDVEAENRFFFQLIDQALPEDNKKYRITSDGENETSSLYDESVENSSVEAPVITSPTLSIGNPKQVKPNISNGKMEYPNSSDLVISKCQSNTLDYVDQWALSTQPKPSLSNGHIKQPKIVTNGGCVSDMPSTTVQNIRKNSSSYNNSIKHSKDDTVKCDLELKRLRSDLQSGRCIEVDLRAQLTQANQIHNSLKLELNQCRQDLLTIQSKFLSLQQKYQTEKQNNQLMDKRLTDEKKSCLLLEQQLVSEKKARKEESEIKSKALQSVNLATSKPSECTESCKAKRRQLDIELKSLKKEKQNRDEQIRGLEQQLSELPKLRKMVEEYQIMSININSLREEKEHLVRTLSDENKIKQNLITAYHISLKDVSALNEQLTQKDYQILQLNMNGVSNYMNNHQSHYHQMQRHTPMSPSSSPLMMMSDECSFYSSNSTNPVYSMNMLHTPRVSKSSVNTNNGQGQPIEYNNIISNNNIAPQQSAISSTGNIAFSGCQSPSSSSSSCLITGYNHNHTSNNTAISSQSRISDKAINHENQLASIINQW